VDKLLQLRLALLQINQLSRTLMGRLDEFNYYKSFHTDEESLQKFYSSDEFKFLYEHIKKDYNLMGEVCKLAKLPKEEDFDRDSGDDSTK
jgi:hypothetical protein